jgi:hypothetical protein
MTFIFEPLTETLKAGHMEDITTEFQRRFQDFQHQDVIVSLKQITAYHTGYYFTYVPYNITEKLHVKFRSENSTLRLS